MFRLPKKIFMITFLALVVAIGAASQGLAAANVSTVQAYQGVKIIYNGTELVNQNPALIINNTTYVPIRLLMNHFGKDISWDGETQQVIINDSSSDASQDAQITELLNKNKELQNQITELNTRISALQAENQTTETSLGDIETTLKSTFADAGDDYFNDSGINAIFSLSGNKEDIYYTIQLDFTDADDHDNLKDLSESELTSFMNAVNSKIKSEADGSVYEAADISGKLSDYENSGYYVQYNGSSYTLSWEDEDDNEEASQTSISNLQSTLQNNFSSTGISYFGDSGIDATINLSGDEDALNYTVFLDVNSSTNENIGDLSQSNLTSFMSAINSAINSNIENTNYEDAAISGVLYDNDNSSYYVKYGDGSYSYSWE